MSIEREIVAFPDRQIKDHPIVDKRRNIELVCYYYGFRGAQRPTLDETVMQFEGIGTRERVRQLLKRDFRDPVTANDIPSVHRFLEIVERENYWARSALNQEIIEANLAGDEFSVAGIFRLCEDLKFPVTYDIYTPDLLRASQRMLSNIDEVFIIRKDALPTLVDLLKQARKSQGLRGIVRYGFLESEDPSFEEHRSTMISIIRHHSKSWMQEAAGELWYLFEDHENTLVNHGRKATTAYEVCDINKVAESIYSAMGRRPAYERPPTSLIKDYLRRSRHFACTKELIRLAGDTLPLTPIEIHVKDFMEDNPGCSFRVAKDHLKEMGYKDSNMNRILTASPLVYVDKLIKGTEAGIMHTTLLQPPTLLTCHHNHSTIGIYHFDSDSMISRVLIVRRRNVGVESNMFYVNGYSEIPKKSIALFAAKPILSIHW